MPGQTQECSWACLTHWALGHRFIDEISPMARSSNFGEDATAAVEGDTPRILSKDLRNGKPAALAIQILSGQ